MKIVITAANGFIGKYLTRYLVRNGHKVVAITRRPTDLPEGVRNLLWDGKTLGDWAREIDGAGAVINLAGRSVNCRYNEENKRAIMDSRIDTTAAIGEAIAACAKPPSVWLNASTATIYRDARDKPQSDISGEIGSGFSVGIATAWEDAFFASAVPGEVRKVALRTSMVIEDEPGTVYRYLYNLARFGLGGSIAGGKQMVSWIHMTDLCRAIDWLIEHDEISGPVNLTAPEPLPQEEQMRRFREFVSMPIGLPATRWMAEIGALLLRTETELIFKSRWVVPTRLLENGFVFQYPEFDLEKFAQEK